jgi:hypothetical protein
MKQITPRKNEGKKQKRNTKQINKHPLTFAQVFLEFDTYSMRP